MLEKRGAAILLEEKDYSTQNVISIIESLYTDQEKITLLSQNAASLAVLDLSLIHIYGEHFVGVERGKLHVAKAA